MNFYFYRSALQIYTESWASLVIFYRQCFRPPAGVKDDERKAKKLKKLEQQDEALELARAPA